MTRPKMPGKAVKAFADRAKEAHGLLTLVKPLMNRADKLTESEQEMLETAVRQACSLLINAESEFYKAYQLTEQTATAVRRTETNGLY